MNQKYLYYIANQVFTVDWDRKVKEDVYHFDDVIKTIVRDSNSTNNTIDAYFWDWEHDHKMVLRPSNKTARLLPKECDQCAWFIWADEVLGQEPTA